MMLDELLAKKIEDPGFSIAESDVVASVRKMIELDGLDH